MMSRKYSLKDIRLCDHRRQNPRIETIVKDIYKCACSDYACFKIINEFFNQNRHNSDSKIVIERRLQNLKEEQENINNLSVNRYFYDRIKILLLRLFENEAISLSDYGMIYARYIEYITLQWKRESGRHGKVCCEPLLKHKRRELFKGKPFAASRCDVIFKNNKTKCFSVYECKFGLITFISHLDVDLESETSSELYKKGRRAKRKIEYLKECETVFTSLYDVTKLDVKIVTLATRFSIGASLHLFDGINLLTREDVESMTFYNQLK